MSRHTSAFVVGLYVLLLGLVALANWRAHPDQTAILRWPDFKIFHEKNAATDRAFPQGIPKFDVAAVKSSINRLPAVALARQFGNSLRIACGQRLNWVTWGSRSPLMLFPDSELWASEGINAGRETVEAAALTVKKYAAVLEAEGWTLVVVPVPTKLSIHRDLCHWPILDRDPLTRRPVNQDRADEILERFFETLAQDDVHFVDLRV